MLTSSEYKIKGFPIKLSLPFSHVPPSSSPSSDPPVFLLSILSEYSTLTLLLTKCVRSGVGGQILSHQAILIFSRYRLVVPQFHRSGARCRSYRLGAQSHKTDPPPSLQSPITSPGCYLYF